MYVSIAEEFYTKKGFVDGEIKGFEDGKLDGKLEVARNLLADGFSPDIIAKNVELPIEKICALMN
jgi:predicted transposase/invertase (TIGR01784 family)